MVYIFLFVTPSTHRDSVSRALVFVEGLEEIVIDQKGLQSLDKTYCNLILHGRHFLQLTVEGFKYE